jgi:NAD(P)-dependent dehydrogenase (short-subunit alcohol dehydrogenase family)
MKLEGKVSIITGGGTGIGKACALRFAREGSKVVVAGLDAPPLKEVVKEIEAGSGEALGLRSDVGIPEETGHIIEATVERFGRIDILVNNAATVDLSRRIEDMTVEEWDRCLNASLRSVFLLSKGALPHMKKAGGGVIINLGSVGAVMPWAEGGAYCAAKAGVLALTKVLAIEFGPLKIRVNAISPGAINTPNLQRAIRHFHHYDKLCAKSVLNRVGEPEEIANVAAFLASSEASFISSSNVFVDGGYLTL